MADTHTSQLKTKETQNLSETKLTLLQNRKGNNESQTVIRAAISRLPVTQEGTISGSASSLSDERNMALRNNKQHGRSRVVDKSKASARPVAAASTNEPVVNMSSPMPPGYKFVRKGNPYITRHCRQETQQAHKTVYTVVDAKNKPVGIRVPIHIYAAVLRSERETHTDRREAVAKRDNALERQFREQILARFPRIPAEELPNIIKQAMKKHSGRVGRTGKIDLAEKAYLAVQAYVRHTKTDYDKLLREGTPYQDARSQTFPRVREVLVEWGAKGLKPVGRVKDKARKRSISEKTRQTTETVTSKTVSKTAPKTNSETTTRTAGKSTGKITRKSTRRIVESDESDSDFEIYSDPERFAKSRKPSLAAGSERRLSLRSAGKTETEAATIVGADKIGKEEPNEAIRISSSDLSELLDFSDSDFSDF